MKNEAKHISNKRKKKYMKTATTVNGVLTAKHRVFLMFFFLSLSLWLFVSSLKIDLITKKNNNKNNEEINPASFKSLNSRSKISRGKSARDIEKNIISRGWIF